MKRALLSVSDKKGIVEFARELIYLGYYIISTGNTAKILRENSITLSEVSEVTGFKECFDGRVKTLNPLIHGAILYKRTNKEHIKEAKAQGIVNIDLVCVNLYPFKETTEKTDDFEEIVENIDIGGPAMIRSGAKNYKDVITITDIKDYTKVINTLKKDENTLEFRRSLMIKAYEHTAAYDAYIANYLNNRFKNSFGDKHFIVGNKNFNTRYGENPHQKGSLYSFNEDLNIKALKGEASFNNLIDMNSAIKIASAFGKKPAVCIVKHNNPCGFAIKNKLFDSYVKALKCDPISAYGGVLAINGHLDKELALKINETFIELIITASISKEALEVFKDKKRIKIFTQESKYLSLKEDKQNFKSIEGGFVLQDNDKVKEEELSNAKLKSNKEANKEELDDAFIAYKITALTKSNCIAYVKNSTLLAIGMGMTSRVDANKMAIAKAKEMNIDLKASALASEAFFPFKDIVDKAGEIGVSTIIQPGGSIRDDEVIKSANKHNIALYFTGIRHFLH